MNWDTPQMFPLNWNILPIFLISIMILLLNMIYYNKLMNIFNIKKKNYNFKKKFFLW